MWYIFAIPEGLILFVLVLCVALSNSAGNWVKDNASMISVIVYSLDAITAIVQLFLNRLLGGKTYYICFIFTALFSAVTLCASTNYLLLILMELADIASEGFMGIIGLIFAAPLAGFSVLVCKIPSLVVLIPLYDKLDDLHIFGLSLCRTQYKKEEDPLGETVAMGIAAIITIGLCTLCRWLYGYPLFPWS